MQLHYYYPLPSLKPATIETDICIYGGTSCGIVTAVQAARLGHRTAIFEFGKHLGGMTTSGLSATDIGNKHTIGGMAREFYTEVDNYYNSDGSWYFEPHIAMKVYRDWLDKYEIPVHLEHRLSHVTKLDKQITEIHFENGISCKAAVFIDASYEGDLLAAAGVSYRIGRESNETYDEHLNGIHFGSQHHNFLRYVDPYRKAGDPHSGMISGIQDIPAGEQGAADILIQAYNFRLCLTDIEQNRIPFPKPSSYDPENYELLRRYIDAGVFDIFNLAIAIPNGKADHNSFGAFNTDFIGANYDWPDGSYQDRDRIYRDHIDYMQGLFWFLTHDDRLPKRVRALASEWGLAADEFTETTNWPPQLYIREARRMISDYILTEHDAMGREYQSDSVCVASYKMDSHNCKRVIMHGRPVNEGNVEVSPLSPFPIPYRCIRPRREECTNLFAPTCPSSSHIALGSVRMEPVFMMLGQASSVAASLAIKENRGIVQDISYSSLEKLLKREGQILREPELSIEDYERDGKPFTFGVLPTHSVMVSRARPREIGKLGG